MKKLTSIKLNIALFVIASFVCTSAFAQGVPVTDSMSTKQTIKNWFTNIKESKVVVDTMNTAKKTSAAIGTAKKSVSEYVIENKKKIEAEVEKVNEYKRQAEEYKAEYDAYKKELDENIAYAKEMKRQAEEGIQTAKDTAAMAKEAAGNAGSIIGDKVSSATGIELGGSTSSGDIAEPEAQEDSVVNQPAAAEQSVEPVTATVGETPSVAEAQPMVVSRQPFVSAGDSTDSAGSAGSIGSIGSVGDVASGGSVGASAPAIAETMPATGAMDVSRLKQLPTTPEQPAVVSEPKPMLMKEPAAKAMDVSRLKQLPATPEQPTVNENVKTIEPSSTRKSLRRSFKTSEVRGFGSVKNTIPVAFAFALELPDNCTDVNGTFLAPKSVCMYCKLSSSKAKAKGALDECLVNMQKDIKESSIYSGKDAATAYAKGKLEMAAMVIAESYKASNKTETFVDNKVAPIAESTETTEQDALSNLVEFNKAVDEQLNGLKQIYSSKLALQSYMIYGKYQIVPKESSNE